MKNCLHVNRYKRNPQIGRYDDDINPSIFNIFNLFGLRFERNSKLVSLNES